MRGPPPSCLATGGRSAGVKPAVPAADIPPHLLPKLVVKAEPERSNGHNGTHPPAEDGALIPEGERNATLTRKAGSMRRAGLTAPEIEAALLAVNAARCMPPLPERDVARIAKSVGRYPAGSDERNERNEG